MQERSWRKPLSEQEWAEKGKARTAAYIETVEEYNRLADMFKNQKEGWDKESLRLIQHYYSIKGNSTGGNLHVVLEEGNFDDESMSWCGGVCIGSEDFEGADLASLLFLLPKHAIQHLYLNNCFLPKENKNGL